jgi:hypothetical protein
MTNKILVGGLCTVLLMSGCTDREAEARRVKEEAEAKARAEAARKEMDALPKTFQTPDYFKKNQPEKKSEPSPGTKKTNP